MTLGERFFAKVKVTDACWLWVGAKQNPRKGQPIGYGVMVVASHPRRVMLAHRLSWELHFGPIPEGINVLHRCDTPSCVNPEHLFLGTQLDNINDCVSKGRKEHGEAVHTAVLTAADVICIRERLAVGVSQRSLARTYGVGNNTLWCIAKGKTWRHLLPQNILRSSNG